MKKWKCTVCGYEWEGETPPNECPNCHSPAEKFRLESENEDYCENKFL